MRNFFYNFIGSVIIIHSKLLEAYYKFKYRKFKSSRSVSGRTHISGGETLTLNSKEEEKAKAIMDETKAVFKEHLKNPEEIFEYIKKQGTPVIKMQKADMWLGFMREDEGFISPQKGLKALVLCVLIKLYSDSDIGMKLETPCMFVMRDLPVSPYTLAYQLYHWMAYSKRLGGYDENTIKNFKNIWALDRDPQKLKTLSLEEILSLKEAIARDVEAIEMVKALAVEISGQKNAMNKLKKDGDAMI